MIRRLLVLRPPRLRRPRSSASGPPAGSQAARRGDRQAGRRPRLDLTVDSIMRGPNSVGYPPSGLRWSGDSRGSTSSGASRRRRGVHLRRGRDGGEPRKLTDEESEDCAAGRRAVGRARTAACCSSTAATSSWSTSIARTRQQITRTTGAGSEPALGAQRDARHLHARQQPVPRAARHRVAPSSSPTSRRSKRDPRETDSQKYVKAEEQKLIEYTQERGREEEESRGEAEEGGAARSSSSRKARRSTDLQLVARRRPRVHRRRRSARAARRRPTCPTT